MPMPLMAEAPKVIPLEAAQVLCSEVGSLSFEQLQHPTDLACFPSMVSELDIRGIEATPSDPRLLFGASLLGFRDGPLPDGLCAL